MSISEQVKELRKLSKYSLLDEWCFAVVVSALKEAADTIESLSEKLQAANMERTAEDCGGWIYCGDRENLPEEKTNVEALSALRKQIPKKIIFNSEEDREYEDYICPNCKDILQQRRKGATATTIFKFRFCHRCGQAIDWSE